MKIIIALMLAIVMAFSLFAGCGKEKTPDEPKDEVENIVVDGQEVSVKDFLIENLSKYIESDSYKHIQENFKNYLGKEPQPLQVTNVIELELAGKVTNSIDIHFLAVKADFSWGTDDGDFFADNGVLIVDYDTGIVYDMSMVDESWFEPQGTKESWIYVLFNCSLVGADYDGGVLITDAETRTELSAEDIADINSALY